MTLRVLVCGSLLASLVFSCGGASFDHRVFDDGRVRYRVGKRPLGYVQVRVGRNDLAFFEPTFGTIAVNSTCENYEDVPERALMNHLLFGTRERVFIVEEVVTLDGRGALHSVVDAELDGVPVTLDVYVLKKDGCIFDLSRTSSRTAFGPGRKQFEDFVFAFAVLHTRAL